MSRPSVSVQHERYEIEFMNVKSQIPRKIAEPTSVFKSEQIGFLQRRSTKQDEITSFPTSVYEVLRSTKTHANPWNHASAMISVRFRPMRRLKAAL